MKKRLFGILLSFALVLTMIPALSQTAFADERIFYVGEEKVDLEKACSGNGWSYDSGKKS